ncbi:MAG: molybdopterin-guanine dinucleotide biosynthesis protein B [Hyphomicrobiaceae bacterium]
MTSTTKGPGGAPVIGIAGWKNSGKTTLVERLIGEFARRGLKVATVKHAHHNFQIDDEATDSARHRRAGASQVAIVSSSRWAIVTELRDAPEPDLPDVLQKLEPCDLILVEGYKSAPIPKIEARRREGRVGRSLSDEDPMVIAIASDHKVTGSALPSFALDDITAIADFIIQSVSTRTKS